MTETPKTEPECWILCDAETGERQGDWVYPEALARTLVGVKHKHPIVAVPLYRHPPADWLPIETAPRDGTPVLLMEDGGDMFRGEWSDDTESWWTRCGQPAVYSPDPSHWMPLPTPPNEAPKMSYGPHCKRCAERRLKASAKVREAEARVVRHTPAEAMRGGKRVKRAPMLDEEDDDA